MMEINTFYKSSSTARLAKIQRELNGNKYRAYQTDGELKKHELFNISDWTRLRHAKIVNDQLADKVSEIQLAHCFRPLTVATELHIHAVTKLAGKYKNFSEFLLEFIVPQIHMQVITGAALKLQNFCLIGAPGIGKSAMLNELTDALGITGKIFDASAIQAAHVLNGLSRNYSSADPGLIFRAMLLETDQRTKRLRPANALFCIDEIEKVGRADQHGSILDLLLALLEAETSRRFSDVCFPELPLNLEHLNWCFTANSMENLSAPLRNRIFEIEIPSPTEDQSIEIAESIFSEEIENLKAHVARLPSIHCSELAKLSEYSPRKQKQLLRLSIARAIHHGREYIEIESKNPQKMHRIGFI